MVIALPGYALSRAARMLIGCGVGVLLGIIVAVLVAIGIGVLLAVSVTLGDGVGLSPSGVIWGVLFEPVLGVFSFRSHPDRMKIRIIPKDNPATQRNDLSGLTISFLLLDDMASGYLL